MKVQVAAASAVLSWVVVLLFLTVWLSSWANLDVVSQLAVQISAHHGHSSAAVSGIAVLVALAGTFLTWRFLVSRLLSGLSGMRPMFVSALVWSVIVVIASLVLDVSRLPGSLLEDPARVARAAWVAAVAVIAKYSIAAYAWRGVAPRFRRPFCVWAAATTSFVALGLVVWGILADVPGARRRPRPHRRHPPCFARVPLARVGFAPFWLARNRHRS